MAKTLTPNRAATHLFEKFGTSVPSDSDLNEEVARLTAQFSREIIDRLVEKIAYVNRIVTSRQAKVLEHHGESKADAPYFTVPEMDIIMDAWDHTTCSGNVFEGRKLVQKACPLLGRPPVEVVEAA